jgi:hypothetical protein
MIDPFRVLESESWRFCCRFRDRVFILELRWVQAVIIQSLNTYVTSFACQLFLLRRWCHGGLCTKL